MLLIRCTKKLQTALGKKKSMPTDSLNPDLGSWYANLIELCGSQCILVAHDKTLFNFLIADIEKLNVQQFTETFGSYLRCVLAEEGFDAATVDVLLNSYTDCQFANTDSRQVLGSLNELAFMYSIQIEDAGGIHSYRVPEIIKDMNRVPMSMLKGKYPIEAFRNYVESADLSGAISA